MQTALALPIALDLHMPELHISADCQQQMHDEAGYGWHLPSNAYTNHMRFVYVSVMHG